MKDEEVEVHLSSCLRMALALKLNNLIFLLRDSISSIVKNDWTIISLGQNSFFLPFLLGSLDVRRTMSQS